MLKQEKGWTLEARGGLLDDRVQALRDGRDRDTRLHAEGRRAGKSQQAGVAREADAGFERVSFLVTTRKRPSARLPACLMKGYHEESREAGGLSGEQSPLVLAWEKYATILARASTSRRVSGPDSFIMPRNPRLYPNPKPLLLGRPV